MLEWILLGNTCHSLFPLAGRQACREQQQLTCMLSLGVFLCTRATRLDEGQETDVQGITTTHFFGIPCTFVGRKVDIADPEKFNFSVAAASQCTFLRPRAADLLTRPGSFICHTRSFLREYSIGRREQHHYNLSLLATLLLSWSRCHRQTSSFI